MSDVISISTNSLSSRKKVNIDGTVFTVRKLGAGDELEISQIIRELQKISKRTKGNGELSDTDARKFDELNEQSLRVYARTFDDGGDGSKAYEFVRSLSFEDRAEMHSKIFGVSPTKVKETLDEAKKTDKPA